MKITVSFILLFFIFSCSNNKVVYWCGDHACINKKEREAHFKKTLTVEVKNIENKTTKGVDFCNLNEIITCIAFCLKRFLTLNSFDLLWSI